MNLKTIIAAASIVLAFSACSKDEMKEQPSESGTISVEISGNLGDLTPAGDTKAGLSPVVRLNWENGDVAYAYDGTTCLGSLTASVDESNTSIARLSGTISAPSGSTITVVYTNISAGQPAVSEGKLSFDFSSQTLDRTPFVVYGTMAYTAGQTTISDKVIPFSFATSVLKVAATGLDESNAIDQVTIGGVNTVCELTLSNTAAPAVSGTTPGSIVVGKSLKTFSSNGGRSIVSNVGVVPTAKETNKDVTFKQGSVEKYSELSASMEIKASKSITIVVACRTNDFVDLGLPSGLKWAKCNIGASTPEEYGYYFFWGGTQGYVYDSENRKWVNEKTGKELVDGFWYENMPHTDGVYSTSNKAVFTKYVPQSKASTYGKNGFYDDKTTLDPADDAASAYCGAGYRMPTSADFQELYENTTCTWVTDYNGTGINGRLFTGTKSGYTDKGLFFPAAGYGVGTSLNYPGGYGRYWSSSLYSSNPIDAYYLHFSGSTFKPQNSNGRCYGHTVRPVSDN